MSFDIPAAEWNGAVADLRRNTAAPGDNARRDQSESCIILHGDKVVEWQHPWWTAGRWDEQLGKWRVAVRPGFVNGLDPLLTAPLPWNPAVFGEVPLMDAPEAIVEGWREVGGEAGEASERVPAYFRALGVPEANPLVGVSAGGELINNTADVAADGTRRLLATDVVLSVARPALNGSVEIVDATGTSGVQVVYRVGVTTARVDAIGSRPRLRLESKYAPPAKPTLADRLVGNYSDPTEDTVLISTLYLLSPANADSAAAPDGTWKAFAKYGDHGFWNLQHSARNVVPKEPPAPIRLFTGLAAGIGDAIGNQILSQINEFSDRVSNAVRNVTMEGDFYT